MNIVNKHKNKKTALLHPVKIQAFLKKILRLRKYLKIHPNNTANIRKKKNLAVMRNKVKQSLLKNGS